MPDLRERLRDVERVAPPDLWRDIELRAAGSPESSDTTAIPLDAFRSSDRCRRLATIAVALILAAAAIGLTVEAFRGGKAHAPARRPITPSNVGTLDVVWSAKTAGLPVTARGISPASDHVIVEHGAVYLAGRNTVSAFSITCAAGRRPCGPMWSWHASSELSGDAVVGDGGVFLTDFHGRLLALPLDCGTGATSCHPMWTAKLKNREFPVGTLVGGDLPVSTVDGKVLLERAGVQASTYATSCGEASMTCRPLSVDRSVGSIFVTRDLVYEIRTGFSARLLAYPASCYGETAGCEPLWTSLLPATGSRNTVRGQANGTVYVENWQVKVGRKFLLAFPPSCRKHASSSCEPLWTARLDEGRAKGSGFEFPLSASTSRLVGASDGTAYTWGITSGGRAQVAAYPASCGTATGPCSPGWQSSSHKPLRGLKHGAGVALAGDSVLEASDAGLWRFSGSCGAARCEPHLVARGNGIDDWAQISVAAGITYVSPVNGPILAYDTECLATKSYCRPLWTSRAAGIEHGGLVAPAVGDGMLFAWSRGRLYALAPAGTEGRASIERPQALNPSHRVP